MDATYRGAKLASYEDSAARTRYTNTYLPNGRLSTSKAQPTGTVGSLTQDWLETFFFNGIGNIRQVDSQRNATGGNSRPDRYETEWYTPESPASGQALDRVVAVGSLLWDPTANPPIHHRHRRGDAGEHELRLRPPRPPHQGDPDLWGE